MRRRHEMKDQRNMRWRRRRMLISSKAALKRFRLSMRALRSSGVPAASFARTAPALFRSRGGDGFGPSCATAAIEVAWRVPS